MDKPSQEAHVILPLEISRRGVENTSIPSSLEKRMGRGVSRSSVDRDALEGRTDTPRGATPRMMETPKLDKMVLQNPLQSREMWTEPQEKAEPHVLQPWEYVRVSPLLLGSRCQMRCGS